MLTRKGVSKKGIIFSKKDFDFFRIQKRHTLDYKDVVKFSYHLPTYNDSQDRKNLIEKQKKGQMSLGLIFLKHIGKTNQNLITDEKFFILSINTLFQT